MNNELQVTYDEDRKIVAVTGFQSAPEVKVCAEEVAEQYDTLPPQPSELERTKSGRVLTESDIQALADEAERGYDVTSETVHLVLVDNGDTQPEIWAFKKADRAQEFADARSRNAIVFTTALLDDIAAQMAIAQEKCQ